MGGAREFEDPRVGRTARAATLSGRAHSARPDEGARQPSRPPPSATCSRPTRAQPASLRCAPSEAGQRVGRPVKARRQVCVCGRARRPGQRTQAARHGPPVRARAFCCPNMEAVPPGNSEPAAAGWSLAGAPPIAPSAGKLDGQHTPSSHHALAHAARPRAGSAAAASDVGHSWCAPLDPSPCPPPPRPPPLFAPFPLLAPLCAAMTKLADVRPARRP